MDAELVIDVAEVDLDGLVAEEQPGSHLLVGQALGDLQRDPQLLGGEPDVDRLAGPRRADTEGDKLGVGTLDPRLGPEQLKV